MSKSDTICLIQPPHSYKITLNCLPTFQVGIGMLSIKEYLKTHGYNVKIIHIPWAQFNNISEDDIFKEILKYSPKLVGIGLNWLHFSDGAIETAKKIKKILPSSTIIVGGQHASLFAEEIIMNYNGCIDGVTMGEAEITFLKLCQSIEEIGKIEPNIKGLVTKDNHGEIISSKPEVIEDLDNIPFFTYDDIWPNPPTIGPGVVDMVLKILAGFERRAALNTVRGPCPNNCIYCIESVIGKVQGREELCSHSPEYIYEHIKFLVEKGIISITIQDLFFIDGDETLAALSELIIKNGLNKKLRQISLFAEPISYSKDVLEIFSKTATVVSLEYGIETGSPYIAKIIGRKTDYEKILNNLIDTISSNIIATTWWMVGLPYEREENIKETLDFIRETMMIGAIPAQVTPLILFPQTPLAMNCEKYGINLRLKTFEDFKRFSLQEVNDTGCYPDLITHESKYQSVEKTIEYNFRIKKFFIENWKILENFYSKHEMVSQLLPLMKKLIMLRYY